MLTPSGSPLPPASLPPPRRRFGRRLNRLPAIIAVVALCIVAGSVTYTLHQRSQDELRRRQLVQAAPSAADASGVTKDAPSGFIAASRYTRGEREPVATEKLPANTTSPPAPAAAPDDEDAKTRESARKEAWKAYWDEVKQVRKDHFDKRKDAVANLKTESPAAAKAAGESPGGASAPAPTPVSAAAGFPGYGGGAGSGMQGLWGGSGFGAPGAFGGYPGLTTPQIDREGQEQKLAFAGQAGDLGKNDVVPTIRRPPDPYAVMAGSFVKFTTKTETNSDVPGSQIGMVTESVYNNDGTCILIPQFTTLIGHYNSVVSTGQDRLPGVLTRLIYPDGSSQAIGAMESADNAGSAGQEDQINRHLIQKFGSAFVASLFGAAIQLSVPHNTGLDGYNSQQVIGASVGQQMGQLGQQIALQNLSIPNTITIRAGYRGTMITDKDIHITPWSCDGTKRSSAIPIMSVSIQ